MVAHSKPFSVITANILEAVKEQEYTPALFNRINDLAQQDYKSFCTLCDCLNVDELVAVTWGQSRYMNSDEDSICMHCMETIKRKVKMALRRSPVLC